MTRKFPLIFAVSLIVSFPLLLSVFGKGGYLHNQALRTEIERLRYADEVLTLQVESLKQQRQQMGTSDALKDAAFKYGYQSEGEQVFYFDLGSQDSIATIPAQPPALPKRPSYEGISSWWILLMALAFSILITLCYVLLERTRRKNGGFDS